MMGFFIGIIFLKILGVRCGNKSIRFALLEKNGDVITFLNANTEHELKIPRTMTDENDQIVWVSGEVERILRQNTDISKVCIKTAEFGRSETKTNRLIAYFDALVILASMKSNKAINTKLYTQIGVKRVDVKVRAEQLVGRTDTAWNEQIADAVCVAYSEF